MHTLASEIDHLQVNITSTQSLPYGNAYMTSQNLCSHCINLDALSLDSLQLLLNVSELLLLPLDVGLDHPRPLLQLLL